MLSFKTILFPVDFSERCRGAVHHVRAIATRFQSKVIVLNVRRNSYGLPWRPGLWRVGDGSRGSARRCADSP
jgi:nucleotide-binding universal stress UspA family protein